MGDLIQLERVYCRTKMRATAPPKPGPPGRPAGIAWPREVSVSPETARALTLPGALEAVMPDGAVLDLTYGFATVPGEVLRRDVRWLNDRLGRESAVITCWPYK